MSAYTEAVDRELDGLDVYPGEKPGCQECGPINPDVGDEGHFSWSPCDACGSSLGGMRYFAHARATERALTRVTSGTEYDLHLNICPDCVCYLANGEEPEGWEP